MCWENLAQIDVMGRKVIDKTNANINASLVALFAPG